MGFAGGPARASRHWTCQGEMAPPAAAIGGSPNGEYPTRCRALVCLVFAAGAGTVRGSGPRTATGRCRPRHYALCRAFYRRAGTRSARLHHERVRNLRRDHAHKLSRRLASDFGLIVVEDLQIRALARGILAKHIADQAWAAFQKMLEYKAAEAGTQLIRVPPGGTSQMCSACGVQVQKPLAERIHRCAGCGLVIGRDINAARNILRLGLSRQASTWPTGACVA